MGDAAEHGNQDREQRLGRKRARKEHHDEDAPPRRGREPAQKEAERDEEDEEANPARGKRRDDPPHRVARAERGGGDDREGQRDRTPRRDVMRARQDGERLPHGEAGEGDASAADGRAAEPEDVRGARDAEDGHHDLRQQTPDARNDRLGRTKPRRGRQIAPERRIASARREDEIEAREKETGQSRGKNVAPLQPITRGGFTFHQPSTRQT